MWKETLNLRRGREEVKAHIDRTSRSKVAIGGSLDFILAPTSTSTLTGPIQLDIESICVISGFILGVFQRLGKGGARAAGSPESGGEPPAWATSPAPATLGPAGSMLYP